MPPLPTIAALLAGDGSAGLASRNAANLVHNAPPTVCGRQHLLQLVVPAVRRNGYSCEGKAMEFRIFSIRMALCGSVEWLET